MYPSTTIFTGFLLFQSLAFANPLPNPQYTFANGNEDGGGACSAAANPEPEYEVTSQVTKPGAPIQIGDSCTPSKGQTCTLGRETSFSVGVGVSVTVGAELGLDFGKIASAGLTAEVSIQTTDGTTDTNQQECSGSWACSMTVTPSVQEVAGTQHAWVGCPSEKKDFPYTVQFPIKNGDHLPVQHGEPCQCRNFDGFDEGNPDAPKPYPNDC